VVLILEEEVVLTEVVIMLLVSPLLLGCEIFIILIMYVLHSCFGLRVIVAIPPLGYSIYFVSRVDLEHFFVTFAF